MDPEDDAAPPSGGRPSVRQVARQGLRDGQARLSRSISELQDRLRRGPSTAFVSAAETVKIDLRRHPVLLVTPALRTVAGLVVLALGPSLWPVLLFAATTAAWARGRLRSGLRTSATIVVGVSVALIVLPGLLGAFWSVVLLLGWLAEDAADWHSDRLIVTDKRLYRRHGVLTRHAPSLSLMGIAYIDAAVPPLGWALRYGTLQLDSAAQQDAPLSRFDLVPDVVPVLHEILRLRSEAMPKYPQQPV